MKNLVLVGNYGAGNLGDEALREYFLKAFPDVRWTVLVGQKGGNDALPRLPFGLRSFFRPWWRTIAAIKASDGMVFGGGSLFTDAESPFACILWWWHALWARIFGKPILLAFQGVGPFSTVLGERCARWVIRHAAFISVRDEESLARVRTWGRSCEPVLTADPALLLFSRYEKNSQPSGERVIIPRTNLPDSFSVLVRSVLAESPRSVTILLMQPSDESREAASIVELCATIPHRIVEPRTVDELLAHVSGASHVLSARYHGALAALALGIPFTVCPQAPGDKLDVLSTIARDSAALDRMLNLAKIGEKALKDFFIRPEPQPQP